MILLFDLDRTLIDTDKFGKGLSNIFGISFKEYNSHVDLFFRKKNVHYTPEAHIEILRSLGHIKNSLEEKEVINAYQKILKRLDSYLFPEAKKTLSLLKKKKHRLFLITLGVIPSQRKKISGAKIEKYFEKIIYEKKNKSQNKFIKSLSKLGEDILIINDKAGESLEIQKILGKNAKIFLINGPHSKNVNHKEKIYKSITELKNIK